MSHQDQGSRNEFRYHHQALLAAVEWLWQGVDFEGLRLRQDCTWPARALATAALLWAWSDELTLGERFTKARQITCRMLGIRRLPAKSYQAFVKLLVKWTPQLVELLTGAFRLRMKQRFPRRLRVAGFWVFGVDGSRLELPRTENNEAAYSPCAKRSGKRKRNRRKQPANKSHTKKANAPQVWITTLWHLGTQLPWSWRLGPSDSSEREHLREMLGELPPKSLLVADAGFPGYELWLELLKAGHELVMRVGGNVRLLKKLGYVRSGEDIVYFWPHHAAAKRQPPLILRLVVLTGGRQPIYVLTSVLDHKRLPNRQVVNLYHLRWGIELFYRHLKQTFDRRKLRSRNGDNVHVEAQWSLLGLWAMALHAQHYQQSQGLDPERLSVAGMLRAYRRALREYKSRPEAGEDLYSLLAIAIKDNYQRTSRKTSREYPRKKKQTTAGPPQIVRATASQIKLAAEIQREQKRLTA
jgi:hypothetical protein